MYDYVIITHIPAFYKVNLYKELAKELKLFVIFISDNTNEKRSVDFTKQDNLTFDHKVINKKDFQNRSKFFSILQVIKTIKSITYKQLLVGGWDLPEFWFAVFSSNKHKNCLSLESTIHESQTSGLKKTIKQLFLTQITTTFASGISHKKLLETLNYKNHIFITNGVGIINKPLIAKNYNSHHYKKRFLFVGRLSPEKNLMTAVNIFNKLPQHSLTIVGTGLLENQLKEGANSNIHFLGNIANHLLPSIFEQHDILILISNSETWGLVIEEALYFGLPIIITNNCGCSDLITHGKNGFIVGQSEHDIEAQIKIIDEKIYKEIKKHASSQLINEKDAEQINVYKTNIIKHT